MNILKIDASGRHTGSNSRVITDYLATKLSGDVTDRDLISMDLPYVNEEMIHAFFTPTESLTDAQRELVALSEELIAELLQADALVIGAPIYNFGPPAVLKAYIDLVCRAGKTFQYTDGAPQGLLSGKIAFIAVASGGTEVESDWDLMTPYLRHVLGFIGITDVYIIDVSGSKREAEEIINHAIAQVDRLLDK